MAVVLIVPGFSGSELYTPAAFGGWLPSTRVWLSYGVIAAGGWRLLGLQPNGTAPSPPLTAPLVPGLPLADYYGVMGDYLRRQGWAVVGARIDWRGTIASDGGRLADQVAALADQAPVHVVAHSRGGLVTRSALSILSARGQLGLVGRVAGLGVPHQGSWQAAALLSGFEPWAGLLRFVAGIATPPIFNVIDARSLQSVIVSWPSVYELLPAPFATGIKPSQVQIVYDAANWVAIKRIVSATWLRAAQLAWPTLPIPPVSVPWLSVAGQGYSTPDQMVSSTPPLSYLDFSSTPAGDGLVPIRWATLPDRPTAVLPVQHAALPYDARVLSAVDVWLRSGTAAGVQSGVSVPA